MNEYEHDEHEGEEWDDDYEDLADADLDPPEYVVRNLLPTGIVFMIAPPKAYKSTVEMALSLAVAGVQCDALPAELREVPETGIVMGASAEASPGELRYMVEQGMGVQNLPHGRIRILADPWRWRLDDPDAVATLIRKLDRVKPRLFWLDPLRDFHSLDEVDAGEMNRLLRPLQRWAKANRACFLVVHHTRKQSADAMHEGRNLRAEDARGTSALFGMADGLIVLTPKGHGKPRVHIDVTLKRGQPWEATVELKVWGKGEPTVTIDGNCKRVFDALTGDLKGASLSHEALAEHLRMGRSTVTKYIGQLRSLGALDKDDRPTPKGAALVAAAVRTLGGEAQ